MRNTPYGYRIEDGIAVIDEKEAAQVKDAFQLYLGGITPAQIQKIVGIEGTHTKMTRMLTDKRYLGTELYPQLMSEELFDKVGELRKERKEKYHREPKPHIVPPAATAFMMKKAGKELADPFEQAQYLYGLIGEIPGLEPVDGECSPATKANAAEEEATEKEKIEAAGKAQEGEKTNG